MKVTILAYGSRGDVQPFVALALGLKAAGHEVRLAAPEDFAGFVGSFGLAFVPLTGSAQELTRSEEGRRWLAAGDVLRFLRAMGAIMRDRWEALNRTTAEACLGADLILGTSLTLVPGLCWAEKLGVPYAVALTCPIAPPTRAYPDILICPRPLGPGWLHRATHEIVHRLYWRDIRADVHRLRARMGLPRLRGNLARVLRARHVPTLHVYSRHLLPAVSDWPANHVITGPLILPSESRTAEAGGLDADLEAWLAAGDPPIFFGFGSMPVEDPAGMAATAAEAGAALGRRVLIGAGWSDFDVPVAAHVKVVAACDHERVFPRCAAVVHHGGAGTTLAGVRAGVPALVCSVFADQPFWGERLAALGVGAHLPFRGATAARLAAKLGPLLHPEVRARAADLAARVRAEDGVAEAVRRLEAIAAR